MGKAGGKLQIAGAVPFTGQMHLVTPNHHCQITLGKRNPSCVLSFYESLIVFNLTLAVAARGRHILSYVFVLR